MTIKNYAEFRAFVHDKIFSKWHGKDTPKSALVLRAARHRQTIVIYDRNGEWWSNIGKDHIKRVINMLVYGTMREAHVRDIETLLEAACLAKQITKEEKQAALDYCEFYKKTVIDCEEAQWLSKRAGEMGYKLVKK